MKMEDCPKYERCNAPICPLYDDLARTTMVTGEKVCIYIIDFITNVPTPIDKELTNTKEIWTAKIGEKLLTSRAIGREKFKTYWKNRLENEKRHNSEHTQEGMKVKEAS